MKLPGTSANDEHFDRREASRPLLAAVETFCRETGRTLDEMEALTMREVSELATQHYGEALPEFWRVWNDWNGPDQIQPMGEL